MQPHEQRVVTERDELQEKCSKLFDFIGTDTWNSLPQVEQDLLSAQYLTMCTYRCILNARINTFQSEE